MACSWTGMFGTRRTPSCRLHSELSFALRVRIREKWYPLPEVCVYHPDFGEERCPSTPPPLWVEILSHDDRMMSWPFLRQHQDLLRPQFVSDERNSLAVRRPGIDVHRALPAEKLVDFFDLPAFHRHSSQNYILIRRMAFCAFDERDE